MKITIKNIFFTLACGLLTACNPMVEELRSTASESDLTFSSLAQRWDEGVPLGNATIGTLVWQRDSMLRFSLDRTDLWDLRSIDSLSGLNFRFSWVKEHIRSKNYRPVQNKLDHPYSQQPAPSKIPGAALEFPIAQLGAPKQVRLYLNNALCDVTWENGTRLQTFVHASEPVGWFIFHNLPTEMEPTIKPPVYSTKETIDAGNPVKGQDLRRLGYPQGTLKREGNSWSYHQPGYNDFAYDVVVKWKRKNNSLYGTWSVTSTLTNEQAEIETERALTRGLKEDYEKHTAYWTNYWAQSSVTLPDSILQKQYDNEMYKFGSTSRENSYPISLQAVWTADNGHLPPWKGDYHHDLNTQLSYWPAYIGNHLSEGMGYLNTLWNQRDTYKRYTRQYFETDGMNIPGVCTLTGEPMGGWIQYAMSQTIGAWLAQHFYLHWKYSADPVFLKERAYPFMKEVAIYLEQQSEIDAQGIRKLEFSSSPEIFDNSLHAWFKDMTNFDLALMHFLFSATAEAAQALNLSEEAAHWNDIATQLPQLDVDATGALTFAKGFEYNKSHRHFSHALAIHPLGILDWSQGEESQRIIKATLKKLKDYGPDWWVGYSYSWYANLQARAFNAEEAVNALRTFAQCFCLQNTFHVNGDQTHSGKSKFTYRPFTLEGNFAFASGVQELLLQSHTGVVNVFPAIPNDWKDVSFNQLRAIGGFLVSAEMKEGQLVKLNVYAEQGGTLKIKWKGNEKIKTFETRKGKWINVLNN